MTVKRLLGVLFVLGLLLSVEFIGSESMVEGTADDSLLRALRQGDISTLRTALEDEEIVDTPIGPDGNTPLLVAVQEGHPDLVEYLLTRGADKNTSNSNGLNPLMGAVANGDTQVVEILLEHGANPDVRPVDPNPHMKLYPPLLMAIEQGENRAIVEQLIDHGAAVGFTDRNGMTPLIVAGCVGRDSVVKLLLARGAKIDRKDDTGWTALSCAVQNGHLPVVRQLLARGADPNALTINNSSPLLLAGTMARYSEVISQSKFPGIARQKRGVGKFDHFRLVRTLLLYGANPNIPDNSGNTALHQYSMANRGKVIDILLHYGANPYHENREGISPLDYALVRDNLRLYLRMLTRSYVRADRNVSVYLHRELIRQVALGNEEAVRRTLNLGGNPNHETLRGWTATLMAVIEEAPVIARILLENGADPCRKNKWNVNAYDVDRSNLLGKPGKSCSERSKYGLRRQTGLTFRSRAMSSMEFFDYMGVSDGIR